MSCNIKYNTYQKKLKQINMDGNEINFRSEVKSSFTIHSVNCV